jgi:hypothetical protein
MYSSSGRGSGVSFEPGRRRKLERQRSILVDPGDMRFRDRQSLRPLNTSSMMMRRLFHDVVRSAKKPGGLTRANFA